MSVHPDRGYQNTRAELLSYEQAAFSALRSGVPNCYRDGADNTAWGWVLRALARHVGDLDYQDLYALLSRDPQAQTPPDLLRRVVPFMPLSRNYPNHYQFDEDFKSMVLKLLKAYRHGSKVEAISLIIEAFTGADPSAFSVTEMFTQIGQPGIDCSYRNTIRVQVPVGGQDRGSNLFTTSPELLQDIYTAVSKVTAPHIGIDLIGKFPGTEDYSSLVVGIRDRFKIKIKMHDGATRHTPLHLAPFTQPGTPVTSLAPEQVLSLRYRWFKNGEPFGEEGSVLNVTALLEDMVEIDGVLHPPVFSVRVEDLELGTVDSLQVPLWVVPVAAPDPLPLPPAPLPPLQAPTGRLAITLQPMARTLRAGESTSLTVEVAQAEDAGVLSPALPPQWVIVSEKASLAAPDVVSGAYPLLPPTDAPRPWEDPE